MLKVGYDKKEDMYNDKACTYANRIVMSDYDAEKEIRELLVKGDPFALVRFGETENRVFQAGETMKFPVRGIINKRRIYNKYYYNFCEGAGFFPKNINLIPDFVNVYKDALKYVDIFAVNGWDGEEAFVDKYCKDKKIIKSSAVNYFHWSDEPWTGALKNKKVLVVSPFAETIIKQYQNRTQIWNGKEILPQMELVTYKPVQQFKELNSRKFTSWFEALNVMTEEICSIEFDVAILGCGAYGLPLAGRIKARGKMAVHLAGSTQLLFGIRGKRWENNPKFNSMFNEFWVRPSESETPQNSKMVEDGCYW